jgi:hypothetical protein
MPTHTCCPNDESLERNTAVLVPIGNGSVGLRLQQDPDPDVESSNRAIPGHGSPRRATSLRSGRLEDS